MTATLTPLPGLAVLRASGAQATDLLQAQLTQGLVGLAPDAVRPAALCSPQGRMLADFTVWQDAAGGWALALDATLAEAMMRRLRMFILRLKCSVDDARAERPCWGLLLRNGALPEALPLRSLPPPWALQRAQGLCAIRLPDAPGVQRVLLVTEDDAGRAAAQALQQALPAADDWELQAVRAGMPHLVDATSGQFVPQMVNFELIGGVDFKKGCYPGQEVVARTEYRGSVKRRAHRVLGAVPMQAGDALYHDADPAQPCGMVVNAAAAGDGWEALAEIKNALLEQPGALHLREASGAALRVADLPYPLPA